MSSRLSSSPASSPYRKRKDKRFTRTLSGNSIGSDCSETTERPGQEINSEQDAQPSLRGSSQVSTALTVRKQQRSIMGSRPSERPISKTEEILASSFPSKLPTHVGLMEPLPLKRSGIDQFDATPSTRCDTGRNQFDATPSSRCDTGRNTYCYTPRFELDDDSFGLSPVRRSDGGSDPFCISEPGNHEGDLKAPGKRIQLKKQASTFSLKMIPELLGRESVVPVIGQKYKVRTDSLYLREGISTKGTKIVGEILNNEKVKVLDFALSENKNRALVVSDQDKDKKGWCTMVTESGMVLLELVSEEV